MNTIKVSVNLNELRSGTERHAKKGASYPLENVLRTLIGLTPLTESEEQALSEKLSVADFCTVVYHACGSCAYPGGDGYLVEYFCNSQGGSTPDFSTCSAC